MLAPPNSARTPRQKFQKAAEGATWSISFIEASKHQARKKIEDERLARWNAGNHDSAHFFRRMGEAMADTDKVKSHCKASALASPSRNAEEKVSLDHIHRNVEAAKTLSAFSKVCIDEDASTGAKLANLEGTLRAPNCLGHLKAFGVEEKIEKEQLAAATKLQSAQRGKQARRQVEEIKSRVDEAIGETVRRPEEVAAHAMADHAKQEGAAHAMAAHAKQMQKTFEVAPPPPPPPPPPSGTEDVAKREDAGSKQSDYEMGMFGEEEAGSSRMSSLRKPGARKKQSDDADSSDSEQTTGEDWPPKAPFLRFRAQCQFATPFKGSEAQEKEKEQRRLQEEKKKQLQGGHDKISDYTLAWVNKYFAMEIETESQFEAAFPLIVLSMIDVIYPKKVRWHQVDWNAGYLHALHKNHIILERIWKEVNMDKLKDFRPDHTSLRLENMVTAAVDEKLSFVKHLKRWFDQRVQHSVEYNPITRRTDIERAVRMTGRFMNFPAWMLYDKEAVQANRAMKPDPKKRSSYAGTENTTEYDKMPEFKRLIWFLGSADHQTL